MLILIYKNITYKLWFNLRLESSTLDPQKTRFLILFPIKPSCPFPVSISSPVTKFWSDYQTRIGKEEEQVPLPVVSDFLISDVQSGHPW